VCVCGNLNDQEMNEEEAMWTTNYYS